MTINPVPLRDSLVWTAKHAQASHGCLRYFRFGQERETFGEKLTVFFLEGEEAFLKQNSFSEVSGGWGGVTSLTSTAKKWLLSLFPKALEKVLPAQSPANSH